jgi:hypothetical protein
MSSARGPWRPPGVGGTFRAVDLFATATGVAARCCQRDGGLWIVGLLHAPSLLFHRRRMMAAGSCEGHPATARLGSGRPMPGPRGLRLSIGDTVRLALPALASVGPVGPCGRRGRLRRFAGSSLGVVKVRPSIGIGAWCPLPVVRYPEGRAARFVPEGTRRATRSHLRPGVATLRTRSALAVPPGCGGLLHLALVRFVAP